MMLYETVVMPTYWHDPLLGGPGEPQNITAIPFSAHTIPKDYYEEQEIH